MTAEAARLAALRDYRILDTEPERAFDDLALLASQICNTPIAFITLIDTDRQWFKSRIGMPMSETPRAVSFCTHAVDNAAPLVVTDTLEDDRFRNNPLVVGAPNLRFYAGVPVTTPDGHALGTLCVADRVTRTLTAGQMEALHALTRQVEAQLELRKKLNELVAALEARDRAEAEREKVIAELRSAHDNLAKLGALIPLCSACQFSMTIPADPSAIPAVVDGVTQVLHDKQWPDADVMAVELALQEAVANAIRHGCGNDPSKSLQCIVTCDEAGEVMIVVRDPGEGFDPSKVANPLDPENLLKPSGRGIFLINGLMDEVGYYDGGRALQMKKRKAPVNASRGSS
jgi:anti-sigma regulatory factor (Ser/Thr protein kinase)